CLSGYQNKDNNPANGCEYNCTNSCSFPFATGACDAAGSCFFDKCLLNHYDLNNNPADGCEYSCAPTNNSVAICDGRDNNCDGKVDEIFNLQTDPNNCGQCGKSCAAFFPHSTVACQAGACVWTGCQPGFNNDDGQTANGCEYSCTPTNGGVEKCDNVDN